MGSKHAPAATHPTIRFPEKQNMCCCEKKLEQKLDLELALEQKPELTLELVGSGRQNDQKSFLTDVCGGSHFFIF